MASKLSTVNRKLHKILKNVRFKIVSSNLKLLLLNAVGRNKNFYVKYLLHNRDPESNKDFASHRLKKHNSLVVFCKNQPSFEMKESEFSKYLTTLDKSKSRSVEGPKERKKGKAIWARQWTAAENIPRLSRGYKDGKSSKKQDVGGERKRKKNGSGFEGGTPGSEESSLQIPPPPLRCRLSCPLPPPEFVPAATGDFCPSLRVGGVRFSALPNDLLKASEGKNQGRVPTAHDQFSIFPKGGNKRSADEYEWGNSSAFAGKFGKIHSSSALPNAMNSQFDRARPETGVKMKALTFAPDKLSLEYRLVEAPTKIHKDEVLIQICFSGVCGTDLFITEGKMSCGRGPLILGHEISGKVYAAGSEVNQVKRGDPVVVNPYGACCACKYCTMGIFSCCLNDGPNNSLGLVKDGGWAEYVVVKKTQVHKVPTELGLEQAALVHPLSCVLNAFYKLDVSPGTTVLIQGLSLTGCLWASVFHVHGHRSVFVNDKNQRRRKQFLALNLGYELVEAEDMGKVGADVIIECTGSPASIEKCLKILNPNGQMCFFGKPNPTTEIRCAPYDIIRNEIKLLGSQGNAFCFAKAINLAATMGYRYLDFHKLGVKVFDLQDFREAFQTKKSGEVSKIMFKINA